MQIAVIKTNISSTEGNKHTSTLYYLEEGKTCYGFDAEAMQDILYDEGYSLLTDNSIHEKNVWWAIQTWVKVE